MDCSYKTNKYKMLMLNVVSVSSFNTSLVLVCIPEKRSKGVNWAFKIFSKILGAGVPTFCHSLLWEIGIDDCYKSCIFDYRNSYLCMAHWRKYLPKCKPHKETQEVWYKVLSTWNKVIYLPEWRRIQGSLEKISNLVWLIFLVSISTKPYRF